MTEKTFWQSVCQNMADVLSSADLEHANEIAGFFLSARNFFIDRFDLNSTMFKMDSRTLNAKW